MRKAKKNTLRIKKALCKNSPSDGGSGGQKEKEKEHLFS